MGVWVFTEENNVVMQCSERNLIKIQQHLASISLLMQSDSLDLNPYCTSNEEMKRNFVQHSTVYTLKLGKPGRLSTQPGGQRF